MEIKLDAVLIGWGLAGVVIILAVVSAGVGAADARSGGFGAFLGLLAPPLGVGILIIAATIVLKGMLERRGAPERAPADTGVRRAVARARTAAPRRASARARTAAPDRAGEAARPVKLEMRTVSLITGILGSLFSLGIGLFFIVIAILVEDIIDDFGAVADLTDEDDILIWTAVGIGVIFLIISALGILGASLAIRKPGAAFVLLAIVAGINGLLFILAAIDGDWRPILLFLASTSLLVVSAVCAFKGRTELENERRLLT